MKTIFVTVIAAVTLAGCASKPPQTLIKTEQVVIMPDKSLFYCPNVRSFPNPETLTDAEVAKLLVTLHKNNTDCQKNINTIWKTLDAAKKTAEKKD